MSSAAMQMAAEECARIWLRSLRARNFRNLERVDLAIAPEGAAFVGDNGQGKTNLLEAVYYLQLFRSFRGARDTELVRFGESAFHLSAQAGGGSSASLISVGVELSGAVGGERGARASRKRVKLDGVERLAIADAVGVLPAVLFAPRDAVLVYGGPAERRRYLDVMLSLVSPVYLRALQQYRAALARRNSALREASRYSRPGDSDGVAAWEPALASAGAIIWSAREEWARRMAPDFASLCEAIGEEEHVTLSYSARSEFPDDPETELRETLERRRQLHLTRGATLDGPHRDDLTLRLGGRDLRGYGSAGQQRTAAIALRLLEAATLRRAHDREPVVLLDDPFAELDARRSGRILDLLSEGARGRSQTLLAVPRDGDVPSRLSMLERYRVRGGTVQLA